MEWIKKYKVWLIALCTCVVIGGIGIGVSSQTGSAEQIAKADDGETKSSDSKISEEKEDENSESDSSVSDVETKNDSDTGSEETSDGEIYVNPPVADQIYITEDQGITFPYSVPNTELVVNKISEYDGAFVEDGSDEKVTGVSAIVVENKGDGDVEYANLVFHTDNGDFNFTGSGFASGSKIVILEKDRKGSLTTENISSVEATVTEPDSLSLANDEIEIEDTDDYSITLTNLSGKPLAAVRVFYKYYNPESNTYLGGITYVSKATDLDENETVELKPGHFSKERSVITMVRTYAEGEEFE